MMWLNISISKYAGSKDAWMPCVGTQQRDKGDQFGRVTASQAAVRREIPPPGSKDRAVQEPAHDQQARHDANTITKDVDTRHQKNILPHAALYVASKGRLHQFSPHRNSKVATNRLIEPLNRRSAPLESDFSQPTPSYRRPDVTLTAVI
ncbi:hypothetical protein HHL08_12010 [Sphingobium sp. AR-3-1]|uniref:Uncharacterized protein n=1 Tax=Sphingobium psychrophilum TaxID=2728834 RepID=A0A7X9WWH4_9SPHN|nr:hypothetical protein [Sphingobium psychrophilum]NML10858.1 hypothetical protein [Sphingobium psychrophilum]